MIRLSLAMMSLAVMLYAVAYIRRVCLNCCRCGKRMGHEERGLCRECDATIKAELMGEIWKGG